jgi:hypothetical protein
MATHRIYRKTCLLLPWLLLAVILSGMPVPPCVADDSEADAVNYAFQTTLSDGFFLGTTENANVYDLPISYFLRHPEIDSWGLKLKIPVTIALYNIETTAGDVDLDILAFVPGVELWIPVNDYWTLVPLGNFGVGKATSGGGLRYIYRFGIKHYLNFHWRRLDFTFGNTLRNTGFFSGGGGPSDNFPSFTTGLDIRFPLGFKMHEKDTYLSIYGVNYYYFDGITVVNANDLFIETLMQWEVGATFSTIPSWKIWFFEIDRVGLGYRFGEGIQAVRFVLGMPF